MVHTTMIKKLVATAILTCLTMQPLLAVELALVGAEQGHAFLVRHRGNCYAVMPDHVAVRDHLPLVAALPQTSGMAQVFHRLPGEDLAIAYVEGELSARCTRSWNDLRRDLNPLLTSKDRGGLSRIQFDGQFIDRAEATIIDADERNFVIVTSDRWSSAEIMSGVSGAVFYLGSVPAGIAQTSADTSHAKFVRMDRVFDAFAEILGGSGEEHPGQQAIIADDAKLGYRVTGQVSHGAHGMLGLSDAFSYRWTGAPVEIEFTLSNDLPVALNQIIVETDPRPDNSVTFPQQVKISVDVGQPTKPYWRDLVASDMTPLGNLEVKTGQTHARRVKLRINSVWHPERPVQIDRVTFE